MGSRAPHQAEGWCGSNSITDTHCPMFHREQVCQNHQNQINQYESEQILRPHYSPHQGTCAALGEAVINSFSAI